MGAAKMDAKGNAVKLYDKRDHRGRSPIPAGKLASVLGHIVSALNDSRELLTHEQLSVLAEGFKESLPILKDRRRQAVRVILWPFEIAQKLLPYVGDNERYQTELKKAVESRPPLD